MRAGGRAASDLAEPPLASALLQWMQGGIGGASARFEYDPIPPFSTQVVETDTVLGVMSAVGYEVLLEGDFALDVQLRGGTGFYEDEETKGHSFALQAGFTWY